MITTRFKHRKLNNIKSRPNKNSIKTPHHRPTITEPQSNILHQTFTLNSLTPHPPAQPSHKSPAQDAPAPA